MFIDIQNIIHTYTRVCNKAHIIQFLANLILKQNICHKTDHDLYENIIFLEFHSKFQMKMLIIIIENGRFTKFL